MRLVHTKETVLYLHIQKRFVRVCERFSVKENIPLHFVYKLLALEIKQHFATIPLVSPQNDA